MLRKTLINFNILLVICFSRISLSQNINSTEIPLTKDGFIPCWIAAGPFDQPLTGFGVPSDKDVIDEKNVQPYWGKVERDTIVKNQDVSWIPLSSSSNGFLDFDKSIRWKIPANVPEKIWYAITGYAAAYVESPIQQNAVIKFGSNSFAKIIINGEQVYSVTNVRNAKVDQDSININLKKGKNLILVKVGNSNANNELAFFEMIRWEWGFYFKAACSKWKTT